MSDSEDVIREIKQTITDDDLGAGLRMLLDLLRGLEKELQAQDIDVVRVQFGQFQRLLRDSSRGDVANDELERRRAGLTSRILGHISFLEPRLRQARLPSEIKAEPRKSQEVPPDRSDLQELVGGYLMSLSWIEHGLVIAKAICKVQGPTSVGTGFCIGPNTLVTNNHVLPTSDIARQAKVIFNFEEELGGGSRTTSSYELDAETFVTDVALDCTMIRIRENPGSPPLSNWGALNFQRDAKLRLNDPVTIIQHPLGAPKKIGILGNAVMQVEAPYVYYTTDTMRGSSGSPVLDTNWHVVALHRAAGKWSKELGRYLNNQGVLFSEISRLEKFAPFLAT
ncbi:MAG: trypsin-like peptidase domain-containing protein [Bradyrhizobium sp.]